MSTSDRGNFDCSHVLEIIDFYIDRELSAAEMKNVERHLAACEGCSRLAETRTALKQRIRQAAIAVSAPAQLAGRVRSDIAPGSGMGWLPLAVAALALLAVAAGMQWFAARRLPQVMQVGLNDHLHCAVPRRFPEESEGRAEMVRDLGPEYAGILPIVEDQLAQHGGTENNLRVVMAHQCQFEGRIYVHVILHRPTCLASLLITRRRAVESFNSSGLNSASAKSYQIAAFQTQERLVYLISNLDQSRNTSMLNDMAPKLKATLHEHEAHATRGRGGRRV